MAFGDERADNIVAVGTVDHRSARIWFRAERADVYVVTVKGPGGAPHGRVTAQIQPGNETDNTTVVVYPPTGDLAPLSRYDVQIASEDGTVLVGSAQFETAPATPEDVPADFSVGVFSCHQPFSSEGELSASSMRLLNQMPQFLRENNVKLLIGAGDQIYADEPGPFSLMSPLYGQQRWGQPLARLSLDQMRAAFQERYRIFWKQTPWLKLMSSYPNYSILDDHEVFDDWGSIATHEQEPYRTIIQAGRLAYLDYQGARQLPWGDGMAAPDALDYSFSYGTVAGFVFDLRSERRVGPPAQVISAAQLARFEAFLAANRAAHVILAVTSVPLVHIPEWVTALGEKIYGTGVDFPDHWSAPRNQPNRNQLLEAIRRHLSVPETRKQRFIILGGDVHVGCAFALRFVGGAKPLMYELTTSSMTNRIQGWHADLSMLGPELFDVTRRMAGDTVDVALLNPAHSRPGYNPTADLNAGLVQCRRNGDETNVRLKLVGPGKDKAEIVYESGWL